IPRHFNGVVAGTVDEALRQACEVAGILVVAEGDDDCERRQDEQREERADAHLHACLAPPEQAFYHRLCNDGDASHQISRSATMQNRRPTMGLDQTAVKPPRENRFGSPLELSRVHWMRPEAVVEVTYLTWTDSNLLRAVLYQGQRKDKPE